VFGGQPSFSLVKVNPSVQCAGANKFDPVPLLLYVSMPYWVDLAALVMLAFITLKSLWTRILPHVALLDLLSNFATSLFVSGQNDFLLIRKINPGIGILLVMAIVFAWIIYHGRELLGILKEIGNHCFKNGILLYRMITGRAKIECPFCHQITIVAFHKPAHKEPKISRISGKSSTKYFVVPESYDIQSGCESCGKSQKEIQDFFDGKSTISHDERLERWRKRGLPLVINSEK